MKFDHYSTVGVLASAETQFYIDTVPSGTVSTNGHKLFFRYAGTLRGHPSATRNLRIYFAGGVISSNEIRSLTDASWTIEGMLIRNTSSSVKYEVNFLVGALPPIIATGELTGINFGIARDIELTGDNTGAGGASDDIVAQTGYIYDEVAA